MISSRILTITTLTALTSVGTALAGDSAPRFEDAPFLGRISGGAGVRYDLDRAAKKTVVTIEVTGSNGKQRTYSDTLYLHRSMNAPRS